MMNIEERTARDIYAFLYNTYYGTEPEEIKFRVSYGSNGVVDKVLDYIKSKYIKKKDD